MAFFDELGRKISLSGQNAIHKTKDMAELSRINSMIAERERSVSEAQRRIGELYAQIHRVDYEPEYSEDMETISQEREKIANLRSRAMEIKGTVFCDSCGSEISATANFCPDCGSRQQSAVEMTACPGCGQQIPAESKFCSYCGAPVNLPAEEAAKEEIF